MIKPIQIGDRWILGRFTQYLSYRRTVVEREEPVTQESLDKCWNGSEWSPQVNAAQVFESEASAWKYLDEWHDALTAAPGLAGSPITTCLERAAGRR
jgi:hypothetical protein